MITFVDLHNLLERVSRYTCQWVIKISDQHCIELEIMNYQYNIEYECMIQSNIEIEEKKQTSFENSNAIVLLQYF